MDQSVICPITGKSMELSLLMPVDCRTGKEIIYRNLYNCSESQYTMVYPRPSKEEVDEFYDLDNYYTLKGFKKGRNVAENWLDKLRIKLATLFDKSAPDTIEIIRSLCPEKSKKILDLGCGSGKLISELSHAGFPVMGIELNPNSKAFQLNLPVYLGSAEDIPHQVARHNFDVIVMSHVLEHVLEPIVCLENVSKLLKDDGIFICEVPNNESIFASLAGITWDMLDVPRHLNFFSTKSLTLMLEKYGFKINKYFYRYFTREFTNKWIIREAETYQKIKLSNLHHSPVDKPSSAKAWKVLLKTIFSPPHLKYDSLLVVASKSYINPTN